MLKDEMEKENIKLLKNNHKKISSQPRRTCQTRGLSDETRINE